MSLISDNKMKLSGLYYQLASKGFIWAAKLLSPINKRADLLIKSRKKGIEFPTKKENEIRLWLHVASLGEFEQARPVLQILKQEIPQLTIFTSFFSPSGYENRHQDVLNDFAFYLPFESKKIAASLIHQLNPDFAIWVKYDFWLHYLNELKNKNIPCFLIAAAFRENQIYFKKQGQNFLKTFKNFEIIACQNKASSEILNQHGLLNHFVSGDPRIDRVIAGKESKNEIPFISEFKGKQPLLIIGSAYELEINLVKNYLLNHPELKCIIAPHFVDEINISKIKKLVSDAILYSELKELNQLNKQIIIIDSIGKLSSLYQYADFAFIGGGFKNGGLHNILEAVVYGIPVCFGPKINKFPEAIQLSNLKLAEKVANRNEFELWMDEFQKNRIKVANRQQKLEDWMHLNAGAASKTAGRILKSLSSKNIIVSN